MNNQVHEDSQALGIRELLSKLEGAVIFIDTIIENILEACHYSIGRPLRILSNQNNFRILQHIHRQQHLTRDILRQQIRYIYTTVESASLEETQDMLLAGEESWWYRIKNRWVEGSPHSYFTIYLCLETNYQMVLNQVYNIRGQLVL